CSSTPSSYSNAEITELKEYTTFVSYSENTLINPLLLRYGSNEHLYIYDDGKNHVLELDDQGTVLRTYGGAGHGPGEFLLINNIFLNGNYLYVVDQVQYRIIRFTLDGELDSSMNYGREGDLQALPPPAPQTLVPRAKDINNQPFVMQTGNVLLPAAGPGDSLASPYRLVDWEGKGISNIGNIPEGGALRMDTENYRAAISEQKIPALYKSNVFPVSDPANSDEFYFIYPAGPKIAKYTAAGKKRWQQGIPLTTELDSVYTHSFEISRELPGNGRVGLNTYVTGVANREGRLYLALGKYSSSSTSKNLWIHEFTDQGK